MGTQTLPARNGNILPTFFDDIRSILSGDFVGRDTTGAPTAGCNLGNSTYPWGAIYASTVILSGAALSTSILESDPYQIVSGRKRSSGNQPDFLRAGGNTANWTVLAATTNLVLQIAGVAATWSADKTVAGTTAPSSQNTATVSDSSAVGQAASRTWGEDYGSGAAYVPIVLSSVGTNISNKVGTWQAFKHGSEYFLAYIDSTTTLSRCFRGYFIDSSGNPIKRSTLTNGDTITLMSLGWVFLDQDGLSAEATYNNPTFSYSTPTSPSPADYWFDQGNQIWKRYNGSSFVQTNRTLVGLVVLDSTNCVATRSFDFFAVPRADSTIKIEVTSNTVAKGSGLFQRVNVNGKRIRFLTSRPVWDTASNLAASTDRYNATVQANTNEYFYVSDQGETKISDIEPYWRADLLGFYHPFNPWRAVGYTTTDGSGNFQSAAVYTYPSLILQQPPTEVVSSSSGAASVAGTTFTDVTNLSKTITTNGRSVRIEFIPDGSTSLLNPGRVGTQTSATTSKSYFQILRNGTVIALSIVETDYSTAVSLFPPGILNFTDIAPAPGTYTYKLQARGNLATDTAIIGNVKMVLSEKSAV